MSPVAHDIAFIEDQNLASPSSAESKAEVEVSETEPDIEIERSIRVSKVICNGCNGQFSNLIQHLNRTKCNQFYDLAQMKIDAIEKKKENDRKCMELRRKKMSPVEKKIELEANAERKRIIRSKKGAKENKSSLRINPY